MLSGADPQLSELITSVPGQLEIEIAAGISTFVRWPNRLDGTGGDAHRPLSNSDEARDLFHSLSKSLQEADAMRRRLGDVLQLARPQPRERTVREAPLFQEQKSSWRMCVHTSLWILGEVRRTS